MRLTSQQVAPAAPGTVATIASAASFGLSGALARGLLDAGWSAGAVVLVRIALGALVVAPIAARALRGRLRRSSSSAPEASRARRFCPSP